MQGWTPLRASHMREGPQLLAKRSRLPPVSIVAANADGATLLLHNLKGIPAGPSSRLGQPPPAARILRSPSGGSHRGSRLSEGGGDGAGFYSLVPLPTNPFVDFPPSGYPSTVARMLDPAVASTHRPDSALLHPTAAPRPAAPAPPGMNPTAASRRYSDGTGAILATRGRNRLPW